MKGEKEKMNIYEKLQNCRVELQKMNLKKTGENKFAGFKYYELADFLPVVNEMFLKHKLSSNFSIVNGDTAILRIRNIEKTDEVMDFCSPIADANIKGCTPVQSLGGVHTYLKRYLYINALEIVENDMLDANVGNMVVEEKPMSEKQKELLNNLSVEDRKAIIDKYGTSQLTFKQASEALKEFK